MSLDGSGGKIEFDQHTTVDPASIVELVQSKPSNYKLGAANQLIIEDKMEKPEARFSELDRLLNRLGNKRDSFVT